MAKGRKTGGRNFQKGVQTYFGKLTEEDKELRKMSRDLAKNVIARNALTTLPELEYKLKNEIEEIPCLELLVMRCLQKAIKDQDFYKLDWFWKTWFGPHSERRVEEKKITIKLEDQNGNQIETNNLDKFSNKALKQIVDGMLIQDEQKE